MNMLLVQLIIVSNILFLWSTRVLSQEIDYKGFPQWEMV